MTLTMTFPTVEANVEVVRPRSFAAIRLIGIGGKKEAGKDAVADHLVDKHGWVKLGMSDPLDEALRRQNPYIQIKPGELLNTTKSVKYLQYQDIRKKLDYVQAKTIVNVRYNLQTLGTEVGRELLGKDTWVTVADNMIFDLLADGKNVVLTGVRFPNELRLINKYEAGETWYVTRPSAKKEAKGDEIITAQHASETSVSADDFTFVIDNDGSLEDLYKKVDDGLVRVRD